MPLLAALLTLALPLAAQAASPGRRVVLIGDSHSVSGFGPALTRLLGSPGGRQVDVAAACSGAPSWFLPGGSRTSPCGTWLRLAGQPEVRRNVPTPAVSAFVGDDVDLVIIALGTNMADWRQGGVGDLSSAGTLARRAVARGARCLWVGPPPVPGWYRRGTREPELPMSRAVANYEGLNAGLRAQVRGVCAYVPSTTAYLGADGVHFSAERAAEWARQVYGDRDFAAALAALR